MAGLTFDASAKLKVAGNDKFKTSQYIMCDLYGMASTTMYNHALICTMHYVIINWVLDGLMTHQADVTMKKVPVPSAADITYDKG
ncbi:uncharacterized protein GGS22DRAFT_184178 [Annulohypoxylon maeteangense]|uniref:uncharacterized protein n=1 Tax=Annulohypoxylon maeteangense TaxID=1927788 RepID=UPI002007AA63|nr:uncharacterized protein GGS22DRAFT_184178 [Annulohypoxylon maeteangense]KAI0888600.1 hypothetical protein GGS22DRAFT_184178 [Annulohypoxylon maeteangense]